MIIFVNNASNNMDDFTAAIRKSVVKMAAKAVGPLYDDFERFDKTVASKLKNKEISYAEAREAFAKDLFRISLDYMDIEDNLVIFRDRFSVEGTHNDDRFDLQEMFDSLCQLYPNMCAYGFGGIDYGFDATSYVVLTIDNNVKFFETAGFWPWFLYELYDSSLENALEDYDEYSLEELRSDMLQFIKDNDLSFAIETLLEKLGLGAYIDEICK